jgi:type II secretory pathway component GspD/PulD (secretin)
MILGRSTTLHKICALVHNADVSHSSNLRPRIRALHLVIATALISASCRKVDAPVSEDAGSTEVNAPVPAGSVSLELKNEPVDEVLQKLAAAAGKAFVIDPDAQIVARCARITLLTGGNMPANKALDLVREVLDSAGLTMVESPTGGIVVRRNLDKPLPAACADAKFLNPPPVESGAASEFAEKFSGGVRQISEMEYELSRASLDLLLENPTNLARAARVVPQTRDGKTVGVRLFGIRTKSPLSSLGLKNGDIVTHVEGQPVTNPEEALKVYSNLKKAKTVELTIERRGQTSKLVYRLTDK